MATRAIGAKAPSPQRGFGIPQALLISVVLHILISTLLFFSKTLDALFLKRELNDIQIISATLKFNELYKPSDTPMKQGVEKKDLPPPLVPLAKPKEKKHAKESPLIRKKTESKDLKKNIRSILDKIRDEAREEKRPTPKENNFPMHEKGVKGARGTGGRGDRIPTPGEMAIQSAMRKYYEVTNIEAIRKKDPQARGFIAIRLVGVGNQFQIAEFRFIQSSGYDILDQQCETAVRSALHNEHFAPDIINERNGRNTTIICQP